MRFSARVVEPDQTPVDEAGELELSADLEQLAAQLRSDADLLASRYPAGGLDEAEVAQPAARRRRSLRRKLAWASTVVAPLVLLLPLLLASAVLMWQSLHSGDSSQETANAGPRPIERQAVSSFSPVVDRSPEIETAPLAAPHMPLLKSDSPSALFLNDVTAPEMEGLVDIWEEGAPPEADLSI